MDIIILEFEIKIMQLNKLLGIYNRIYFVKQFIEIYS